MRYGDAIEGGGMSDGRDPAVKLFGRKIPLPEEKPLAGNEFGADLAPAAVPLTKGKEDKIKDIANTERELSQLELHSCSGLSICIEDEKKGSTDIAKETEDLKPKLDYKEAAAAAEDKILRKPDKVLQCPRCNSMDTKFCYYNNYNVNQPRYFCKSCQRYWTSGGTMRHVPVGAGRRKNKHSVLSHPHTVQADAPDLIHHQAPSCGSSATMPPLKFNGTVLKFGPDTDTPHCELTTSVLSIEGQKKAEESSCSSSVTAAKYAENDLANDSEQKSFLEHQTGVTPSHNSQCFLVPPWAFAWNPGWNNDASMSWCQPQLVTAPAFCAPIPFAFAPASFVGWVPTWMSSPWSMPLIGNCNGLVSSSTSASNCSGNGSPTLGKHCRDANSSMGEEGKLEKSLWVPKTLRIDDIDEAAKSSIFSILGIKPNEEGLFRTFSSNHKKGDGALSANPAALSRSQAFQETAAT